MVEEIIEHLRELFFFRRFPLLVTWGKIPVLLKDEELSLTRILLTIFTLTAIPVLSDNSRIVLNLEINDFFAIG